MPPASSALPVRLRTGGTVFVPPSLRVLTSYVLLEQEAWFEHEVEFVRRYLRPGECALDAGASFGVYATAMAASVGPQGKVHAFEPVAQTAACLRATVQLGYSAQVTVVQAAASDRSGQAALHVGATPELSRFSETGATSSTTETVALTTLDEYIFREGDRPVAFLKLDVEGHELQAGRGARNLLARDEPLVMFEIKHATAFDFDFLDFLTVLGWSGYRLAPGLNILVPFSKEGAIDAEQVNLFGCSRRRAEELQQRGLLAFSTSEFSSAPAESADPSLLFSFGAAPPPHSAYSAALGHFAHAQLPGSTPEQALGHLRRALHSATRACEEKNTCARRVTLARIAADLGHFTAARNLLQGIVADLMQANLTMPTEPCLLPAKRYSPADRESSLELFRIATLETYERLRAFSSLRSGIGGLPLLEFICRHPLSSAELHRRRQLVRMRTGRQAEPEPEPALIRESDDNLNAWFRRGDSS